MADFETTYRAHVEKVASGDLKGALDDMAPGAVPVVFDGVTVPGADVAGAEVIGARVEGDRATGEAVYETPAGRIGLRSGWALTGDAWLADTLENFDA
ncbi:hypothetical protein [Nocardioides sp. SYSU DS0651]|uniref:hypothetical protein n=1 Tax=Nocardioides sp. SYSU DS0651 TaxID=3415955 RepID=UPI003F4CA5CF